MHQICSLLWIQSYLRDFRLVRIILEIYSSGMLLCQHNVHLCVTDINKWIRQKNSPIFTLKMWHAHSFTGCSVGPQSSEINDPVSQLACTMHCSVWHGVLNINLNIAWSSPSKLLFYWLSSWWRRSQPYPQLFCCCLGDVYQVSHYLYRLIPQELLCYILISFWKKTNIHFIYVLYIETGIYF